MHCDAISGTTYVRYPRINFILMHGINVVYFNQIETWVFAFYAAIQQNYLNKVFLEDIDFLQKRSIDSYTHCSP